MNKSEKLDREREREREGGGVDEKQQAKQGFMISYSYNLLHIIPNGSVNKMWWSEFECYEYKGFYRMKLRK